MAILNGREKSIRKGSILIALVVNGAAIAAFAACSSSSSGSGASSVTCASPGIVTAGAADTHCKGQPVQPVSQASCNVSALDVDSGPAAGDGGSGEGGADGGSSADTCDYGPTMFGTSGDDDDCKYHVVWSTTQICEGSPGVTFKVTVTSLTDGSPVANIPQGILPEVFVPKDPNAACDTNASHVLNPPAPYMVETPPGSGTYVGNVTFDQPGQWTVRFHIHEECDDVLDNSPHGHAAFRVTVP